MSLDFSVLLSGDYPSKIMSGFLTMLGLSLCSWLLAMVLGAVLAIIRMSNQKLFHPIVAIYVEYHQNVPMLVQLFIWYFGIPALLPVDMQRWINEHHGEFLCAFISIGLTMSAYMSEDLRGGIRSIPYAQYETSRALGLSYLKTARLVVMPQALRIALPALVNHSVLLFKNSSLAMAIGLAELTYVTREIESESFHTVEVYLLATLIYLAVSLLIMYTGSVLEQRYRIQSR